MQKDDNPKDDNPKNDNPKNDVNATVSNYTSFGDRYPVLSKGWRCVFKICLNAKPQTINNGTSTGGAAQGFVVGEDQIIVGGGGAVQGLLGGGGASHGLVGGGGASQGLFGRGGGAQGLVGGGGASQGLVGGDDQLLGSVTLNYCGNITAPVLDIQLM